jgi:hypothetical protein
VQKVEQPAENCRVLLFDDFNTDKGSIEPKLSGRIRLSVNKGGCYMSTIRSGGTATHFRRVYFLPLCLLLRCRSRRWSLLWCGLCQDWRCPQQRPGKALRDRVQEPPSLAASVRTANRQSEGTKEVESPRLGRTKPKPIHERTRRTTQIQLERTYPPRSLSRRAHSHP